MTTDGFHRNAILAQLPEQEYSKLRPHLQLERPQIKHSAYRPGEAITDVYFPLSSVYSVVAVADGRVVLEVATIGHEGMVGLPVFLGATSSPQAAFCQVAGETARVSVSNFRQGLTRDGYLHGLLNRFAQATMVQISQNVVCNRTHPTEARMARWLLTTQDRVGREHFQLTQEFMAQMLGVHRPTVSDTAGRLQKDGLIRYSRGNMGIINRPDLERIACECYRIVKDEFDDLGRYRP